MQGFNRYYPPDFDPQKHGTLNNLAGKHALGDRARKLDQGILIARFELPFNIWCGGCGNHIGQGVRYNAEKKRVGAYYSTSIYSFRCKCHLCSHWFEIRTDPKNTRYVVHEGARQKHEEWDPEEAGQHIITQKDPDAPQDGFATAEKAVTDKANALSAADRLEHLQTLQEERWSDPYILSKKLRKSFREEKKERVVKEAYDQDLQSRIGLAPKFQLELETESSIAEAKEAWQKEKAAHQPTTAESSRKRRRLEIEQNILSSELGSRRTTNKLKSGSTSASSAKNLLTSQLLGATSKRGSIFDSRSSSSASKALANLVKKPSLV